MSDIHVGDVGTAIILTVNDSSTGAVVDISSATTLEIVLRKPNGTSITRTAEFVTDGADGKLQYVTIAGDIDRAGEWSAQGYISMPVWSGHTDEAAVTVVGNLA